MSSHMKLSNTIENLFDPDHVQRMRLGDHWLYAVLDLIAAVMDDTRPADTWDDIKRWEPQLSTLTRPVKLQNADGSWGEVEMVDLEGAFRLIQAIPSPKAEKAKRWLAEMGRQHIEEINDPELIVRRMRSIYRARGYSDEWIEKRLHSTGARHELTRQWARRGAAQSDDYRALTNAMMASVFGMDVQAYRRYKGLASQNLRDHMNELELALMALAETTASILHKDRRSEGLDQLHRDVADASHIAGKTRAALEEQLGRPIATAEVHPTPAARKKVG